MSKRTAPDPDMFAPWQLCWLNWAPISLCSSFPWEIHISDCDLNESCFQWMEAKRLDVIFIPLLGSACSGQQFCVLQAVYVPACSSAGTQFLLVLLPFAHSRLDRAAPGSRGSFRHGSTHVRSLSPSQTTVVMAAASGPVASVPNRGKMTDLIT